MGDIPKARQILNKAEVSIVKDQYIWMFIYFDLLEKRPQDALDKITTSDLEDQKFQFAYLPKDVMYGGVYELMDQKEKAKPYHIKARKFLEQKIIERPDDPRMHAVLGKVYGMLGLKDEAVREGLKAVELVPVSKDALLGPDFLADLAEIYTRVGDYDSALDKLEYLMEIPAGTFGLHIGMLKIDPTWDKLRDNPRFQKLIEREEGKLQ
jgi:tetratricopeptide (TPR) repeat protein